MNAFCKVSQRDTISRMRIPVVFLALVSAATTSAGIHTRNRDSAIEINLTRNYDHQTGLPWPNCELAVPESDKDLQLLGNDR